MTLDEQLGEQVPADVLSPARRLEEARDDLERRRRLGARLAEARTALAAAREERGGPARRVDRASTGLDRMTSGTAVALWSRLRGRRDGDLARLRAELERAHADLAAADARVGALRAEVDRLVEESEELVDADRREQSALEDLALGGLAWDGQDPVHVAQARAEVDRRNVVRELDIALATGMGLLRSLELVESLAVAFQGLSWTDHYDVAKSRLKYQKLAELVPHVHAANDGLAGFAARAGALGALEKGALPALDAPQIDRRVRAADEWLDDPVSDVLVLSESRRLVDAARLVLGCIEEAVAELRRQRELVPTG